MPPEALVRAVLARRGEGWPWTIPALASLEELPLAPGVTFLVGENGSGKSTLIEGFAVAAGFQPEGGSLGFGAHTRDEAPPLADALTLVRGARRPRTGFFLTDAGPVSTDYEDTDHFRTTRAFLDAPDRFLRELFGD